MFCDGERTLLFIVPRGDEHHRHSKPYRRCPFRSRDTCPAHPVMRDSFFFFTAFRMVEGKIRSMYVHVTRFRVRASELLEQAKYPCLL